MPAPISLTAPAVFGIRSVAMNYHGCLVAVPADYDNMPKGYLKQAGRKLGLFYLLPEAKYFIQFREAQGKECRGKGRARGCCLLLKRASFYLVVELTGWRVLPRTGNLHEANAVMRRRPRQDCAGAVSTEK